MDAPPSPLPPSGAALFSGGGGAASPGEMVVAHTAHARKMEPFMAFLKAKDEGKSSLY